MEMSDEDEDDGDPDDSAFASFAFTEEEAEEGSEVGLEDTKVAVGDSEKPTSPVAAGASVAAAVLKASVLAVAETDWVTAAVKPLAVGGVSIAAWRFCRRRWTTWLLWTMSGGKERGKRVEVTAR
jgi:hypothetical protein